MIKQNDNPINSNFWHLFTKLISRFAQMHKETNITMAKWENHFNKLQYGLTFDENNPDVTGTSEDENCNKKLIQNDTGSSQDKLYDKHKTHSLDECTENITEKLQAAPKHLKIDKKKRWTFNQIHKNFPTKHLIRQNHKQNAKVFVCAITKIFGIQKKKHHEIKNIEKM